MNVWLVFQEDAYDEELICQITCEKFDEIIR